MSFTWPKAKNEDRQLLDAIAILLGNDPRLLTFLLDPDSPRLRKRAGILKEDSWKFSDAEQLQIRAALDFWSGSGHLQLWEMLEEWDENHWRSFLRAIQIRIRLDARDEG